MLLRVFPILLGINVIFSATTAQANPSPLVKRSDAAVKMLRSFHDRFSCAPQIEEKRIAFTRYEIASAVSACSDRVNKIIATATSDSLSRSDLENLQQLRSTFSLELGQMKAPAHPPNMAELARQGFSLNTGLQSIPVFAPDTVSATAQLEALERNQFSHTTKSEATVVFPENSSNPESIAQANPSQWVKRSDAMFQQWKLVRDKFGCEPLPWTPIPNPGFTRYEMATAIIACYNRVNEFMTRIDQFPAASPEDLKTLQPILTEFAAEITTLRGRSVAVSDLTARKIVVYTPSGRTVVPYSQFTISGPRGEAIFSDSGAILTTPRKPSSRPIEAWIIPALKELQNRYSCPNNRIQITNPSDRNSSRYEVAAIINACVEDYHKREVKLRKIDADDFLNIQRSFSEELVTLQERNREVQRQKCLAQLCE